MLTFVLLCLQGTGGQAYAQEDKAGERRIRYSSSYLKEAEIPEAPEEYLEEGEITYRLVGTCRLQRSCCVHRQSAGKQPSG